MKAFARGIASIKIPIPTFKIEFSSGPMGISIPKLDIGVNWKALSDYIPFLADGGIVFGPTLAMIGERGPEAVVPLDSYSAGVGRGGSVVYVYITGNTVSSGLDLDRIGDELIYRLRRAGVFA